MVRAENETLRQGGNSCRRSSRISLKKRKLSRRNFLLASAYGVSGVAAMKMFGPSPVQAMTYSDPTIAWSYRNRTNPYWNEIVSGGEAFVRSLGKTNDDLTHLINEGSSEKSLADVKALLAKTNGELALAIDTNDAPNARPVVEACAAAGAYVSTLWNKTDDLHPWDFRRQLRQPHVLVGREARRTDCAYSFGSHGRQGRCRASGRHCLEQPGHRASSGS